MRRKLAIMMMVVALLPLFIYGAVAIIHANSTTAIITAESHEKLAHRAASEIALYIRESLRITSTLADFIAGGVQFDPVFAEESLGLFRIRMSRFNRLNLDQSYEEGATPFISVPKIEQDGHPHLTIRVPVVRQRRTVGMLMATLDLSEMWDEIERIRIGQTGFLLLFDPDGRLLAHGNPLGKPYLYRHSALVERPFVAQAKGAAGTSTYTNELGDVVRGLSVALPDIFMNTRCNLTGERQPRKAQLGLKVVVEQSKAELDSIQHKLTRNLVIAVLAFWLIMIVMAWLLGTRLIVKPVNNLLHATHKVSAGDLGYTITHKGKDELAKLAEAFNNMSQGLARLQNEVAQRERVATIGQVAAGLAHDLKHPVQNLKNASNLMCRMSDDPEALEDFRHLVHKELLKLEQFLGDLRQVTASEKILCTEVDVGALVQSIVQRRLSDASEKGVALKLDGGEHVTQAHVHGNEGAIERIVENLLGNALDATESGGWIEISMVRRKNAVSLIIKDNGYGISQHQLNGVFEAFISSKRGGLGMGLAVCRRLTESMGGRIWVESTEGVGTKFTVELLSVDQTVQAMYAS